MPIEPPEIPPATPGQPTEPPREEPPGSPRPEVPPPVREPGQPPPLRRLRTLEPYVNEVLAEALIRLTEPEIRI
jgi:hypothetical protein